MELRPRERRRQAAAGLLLVLPTFLITVLVALFPIAESIRLSLGDGNGGFTLANYLRLFTDANSLADIAMTLEVVLSTVASCLLLSYALSYYLAFANTGISRLLGKLYQLPLFMPGIVAVYAIIGVIRDTGALNRFLLLLGISYKPGLMYTGTGIVLINLWFNIPFATMIIAASMGGIPRSFIESARDAGASRLTIFRRIVFPLSAKSSMVAALFVFMNNIGEFTTPFLVGSNAPHMLGVALYQEFDVFHDMNGAAAMLVFLFFLSAFAGVAYMRSMMREDRWKGQ